MNYFNSPFLDSGMYLRTTSGTLNCQVTPDTAHRKTAALWQCCRPHLEM